MKNLADWLRQIMNSGPFGFQVSYSGVAGHEPVYGITVLDRGDESLVWSLETRDAIDQIDCILIEAMNGKVSDVAMQAAIYTALLIELESVIKESDTRDSLTRALGLEYPLCYLSDKPADGGK